MRNRILRGAVVAAAVFALPLAGCEIAEDIIESNDLRDAGYSKVSHRTADGIPAATNPDPPVARPLIGAGAGEVPTLASAPAGVTQEMVEQGAQLYGTVCSACHAAGGAGTAAAPALNDAQWINISGEYDAIVSLIRSGVPSPQQFPAPMPPMGGGSFDDDEVRALAAYVFALSHSEG